MRETRNIWLPVGLMVVFALSRWPGLLPENFSAAYALAFCAGVFFPGGLVWWLPLATLFATDALLNLFYYHVPVLSGYLVAKNVAFLLLIVLGRYAFKARDGWLKLVAGGLAGAIIFYLVTNTAAWLHDPSYPKTLAGWLQALTTGLPGYPPTWTFFRSTLLSGGLFTGLFVGAMKLESALEKREQEQEEPAEEDEEPAQPEESKA